MNAIFKGYNDKKQMQELVSNIISNTKQDYIYNEREIKKPTYDESIEYQNQIKLPFVLNIDSITIDVQIWLSEVNGENIANIITRLLLQCKSSGLTDSMLKNLYIRLMIALKYKFLDLISNKGNILYIGKPDKYEFVILTLLMEIGVTVTILDFDNKKDIELIIENRFEIKNGNIRDSLKYEVMPNNNINIAGDNRFSKCNTYSSYLDMINENINSRKEKGLWNVIHLELAGVAEDKLTYSQLTSSLIIKAEALSRSFIIVENGIGNPSFEENKHFNDKYKIDNINIEGLLASYPVINNTETVNLLTSSLEELVVSQGFVIENKKNNYKKVMIMWLVRYLDVFYRNNNLNILPLFIAWGSFSKREEEFISLLSLLPVDIVHIAPNELDLFKVSLADSHKVRVGNSSDDLVSFPRDIVPVQARTVAYEAERELDTLLYDGTSGMYRPNQFRNIEPVTLNTTYDEIGILWNQEAKYRPSFEVIGNLVRVGTIFTKVNGIPYGNTDEYLLKVKSLLGQDVIFSQLLPFSREAKDYEWIDFVKQTVYKDSIDFEKIKRSKHYKYGVFSLETQDLIIEKIEQLLKMNWCSQEIKNLTYTILEVLFTLPANIVQLIHSYDFTGTIPKLLLFSGGMDTCSLEDSIVIMFLKLIGFDILILAPTGYQLIENYINPNLFNSLTVGNFNFELDNFDITKDKEDEKGFFKTIFEKIGGK